MPLQLSSSFPCKISSCQNKTVHYFQDWISGGWFDQSTPLKAVSMATGLAIIAMVMIFAMTMGCQMAFLRTLRRSFATWDRVMAQPAPPAPSGESVLPIQPVAAQPSISASNWAIMRGQTSTFQPEGRGSNFHRDAGGKYSSLPRIHRPAPPPPVAPYRSFRAKGRRQLPAAIPLGEMIDLDEMEDIGETQL